MECLICNSSRVTQIGHVNTTRRFEVVRCKQCQFVFTIPRPTVAELVEHYGADYFTNSSKEAGYNDYYSIGEMNMRNSWKIIQNYAQISRWSPGAILDVGCASGAFLNEARADGWTAKGIELSEDAVQRAREHYSLDVEQGDIFHESLSPASYNIVTMWHVLEHTLNPLEVLLRVKDLLIGGGLLFIEVPSWNSAGRMLKRMNWSQLVPPAHLNFFNAASMRCGLEKAGFEVMRCSSHYVTGFDRLEAKSPGLLKPVLGGIERTVEAAGYGGYLRGLARKQI